MTKSSIKERLTKKTPQLQPNSRRLLLFHSHFPNQLNTHLTPMLIRPQIQNVSSPANIQRNSTVPINSTTHDPLAKKAARVSLMRWMCTDSRNLPICRLHSIPKTNTLAERLAGQFATLQWIMTLSAKSKKPFRTRTR